MSTKIPDGLTVKVTKNIREQTTRILAYRKGGFKRAYKAIIPMCTDETCRRAKPHSELRPEGGRRWHKLPVLTLYHSRDVDTLVKNLIKSYS